MSAKFEAGMQCYFCKKVAPNDQIEDVSFTFDETNAEHQKIISTMPDRLKRMMRKGDKIGVFVHVRGRGCME